EENPGFPVAPAWPDQDGAGAHANVSGMGVVRGSDAVPTAVALMEWLTSPPAQERIVAGSEFAANPEVAPPAHIRNWADVKIDPIAVEQAGPLLDEAVALMLEVGWN
ncbi:MAG: extracellular solute-binding protein, partial [Actinomycetota bacterium]|nr:extracellular solute-binding protein [Actinomycetota bacterium]